MAKKPFCQTVNASKFKTDNKFVYNTSVAMCTFNGAEYIEIQLNSILNQSQPVGEIVVCDDGSEDDTLNIVERIRQNTSIPIRVFRNKTREGVCANFYKAISLCKGDFIFLSDQDDIWESNKVEYIIKWFYENKNKEAVFTDGTYIDSYGKVFSNGYSLFKSVGMDKSAMEWFDKGYAFEVFVKNNRATGATMAIRRSIIDNLIPLNTISKHNKQYHDFLIAISAIQRNSLGYIAKPLIKYRIHKSQTCGKGEINSPVINNFYDATYLDVDMDLFLSKRKYIKRYHFMKDRKGWLFSKKKNKCMKNIMRYIRFYGILGVRLCINDCRGVFS